MSASPVHVTDLCVTFPGRPRPGLRGDLEVPDGGRVLVVGPSGGGKSTLLHTLTGVVPQSVHATVTGHVSVLGRDPRTEPVPRLALGVGWLGQDPASNACLPTVEDEVALPLENRGVPRPEIGARVHRALAEVGAAHLAGRRTSRLSGGEQQRVALAAVLVGDPQVLLLDEPTSMLDPVAAARVLALLDDATRGRTSLVVEHRVRSMAWRPERTIVIGAEGRIAADAPTVDVLRAAGPRVLPPRPRTGAGGDPVLELDGASFVQGGSVVVHDVRLALRRGQVTAIVGTNGSGKSSLLLGAAGLLPGDTPSGAHDVALVFQRPEHQLVARTVATEVGAGADGSALLARFGLAGLGEADPFRLSGGQQRRLSIAAMAALRRGVLLLDEPTFGLDDEQTRAVVGFVADLAAQGTAVAFATHDLELARGLADQVLVLRAGEAVAVGGPALLDDVGLLAAAGLLVQDAGAGVLT